MGVRKSGLETQDVSCEHSAALCFSACDLGVSRVFKKWPVLLADGGRKGRVGLSKCPVSALTHLSGWFSNAKSGGETQLGFLGGWGTAYQEWVSFSDSLCSDLEGFSWMPSFPGGTFKS